MLKTRIIPCLTVKDRRLVKSVKFDEHRNIGSIMAAVRVFNARDVDEMIVLDLDAHRDGIKPAMLEEITKECFMPLTIGGGVKTLEDIQIVLGIGADKISINTSALESPEFIREASKKYGNQCIVVSLDVRKVSDGYEMMARGGKQPTGRTPVEWAKEAERHGAGELLLTSIDHDGMMDGYDIELVRSITQAVRIPIIACGGAGRPDDFVRAIRDGSASAAAAASIFQFTQVTPMGIKQHLQHEGIDTRVSSQ